MVQWSRIVLLIQETQETVFIPGLWRSPGEGNGNPLQDSCLKCSTDIGAWWATVCESQKRWTQLSDWAHTHINTQSLSKVKLIYHYRYQNTSFLWQWSLTKRGQKEAFSCDKIALYLEWSGGYMGDYRW